MPLYEYRCTACGQVFEKIQSFNAPEQSECPKCGGTSERLLSAPAIQFKGSGFYLTDYGKAGGSGRSSTGESKGEGKSESKPGGDSGSGVSSTAATPASASSNSSSGTNTASGANSPSQQSSSKNSSAKD